MLLTGCQFVSVNFQVVTRTPEFSVMTAVPTNSTPEPTKTVEPTVVIGHCYIETETDVYLYPSIGPGNEKLGSVEAGSYLFSSEIGYVTPKGEYYLFRLIGGGWTTECK